MLDDSSAAAVDSADIAVRRVAMWSGPRTLSTAMMRSFAARPDCVVVDEPLYAFYLAHTDKTARETVAPIRPLCPERRLRRRAQHKGSPIVPRELVEHRHARAQQLQRQGLRLIQNDDAGAMLCSFRQRPVRAAKRDSKNCTLVVTISGASQFSHARRLL